MPPSTGDNGRVRCYTSPVKTYPLILFGTLLSGCNRPCDAEVTNDGGEFQTATVVWKSSRAEGPSLSFDGTGDRTSRSAAVTSSDKEHSATLWGLQALSDVSYTFSSDKKLSLIHI